MLQLLAVVGMCGGYQRFLGGWAAERDEESYLASIRSDVKLVYGMPALLFLLMLLIDSDYAGCRDVKYKHQYVIFAYISSARRAIWVFTGGGRQRCPHGSESLETGATGIHVGRKRRITRCVDDGDFACELFYTAVRVQYGLRVVCVDRSAQCFVEWAVERIFFANDACFFPRKGSGIDASECQSGDDGGDSHRRLENEKSRAEEGDARYTFNHEQKLRLDLDQKLASQHHELVKAGVDHIIQSGYSVLEKGLESGEDKPPYHVMLSIQTERMTADDWRRQHRNKSKMTMGEPGAGDEAQEDHDETDVTLFPLMEQEKKEEGTYVFVLMSCRLEDVEAMKKDVSQDVKKNN